MNRAVDTKAVYETFLAPLASASSIYECTPARKGFLSNISARRSRQQGFKTAHMDVINMQGDDSSQKERRLVEACINRLDFYECMMPNCCRGCFRGTENVDSILASSFQADARCKSFPWSYLKPRICVLAAGKICLNEKT